jgi:hypothetical protein
MSDEEYIDYPDEEDIDQVVEEEQIYAVSYRQQQETMYIKDECSDVQLLGDIRLGPKNRIYYEEVFKSEVCQYLQQINQLLPSDSRDKSRLVSSQTLAKIPDINYKNVIGYTLGYFSINNSRVISADKINFIRNNMIDLRVSNLNVVLRYARFWQDFLFPRIAL